MTEYIPLHAYDTVLDAKDAEQQLARAGITGVMRSGKKLNVDAAYESQARALLAGTSTPTDVAATVTDTASDAATTVRDAVASAASTVGDTAQDAASTVVDTTQQVASTAASTVQDAASAVTDQASTVTSVAADHVRDLADTVRYQGSSLDAPRMQRHAAETMAGVLDKTSQYLQPGGFQTLVRDLRTSVQRHPLRSLLVGLGVGYVLRARFFPSQASVTVSRHPAQPSTPIDAAPAGSVMECANTRGALRPL
jgi:hypothetical protein